MNTDPCAWPRCRSQETSVIWLGLPLCERCHARINSIDPPETKPLGSFALEEAKRILKLKKEKQST